MANTKKKMANTKKTTKAKAQGIECVNTVSISGTIQKILTQSDKCVIFTLDSTRKTPKGNYAHTWATVCEFEPPCEYEEGDAVTVNGYLATDSYEKDGKKLYQLRVIAEDGIEIDEEIPFN